MRISLLDLRDKGFNAQYDEITEILYISPPIAEGTAQIRERIAKDVLLLTSERNAALLIDQLFQGVQEELVFEALRR